MSHVIAVIGLGYVGLPLVIEFGKHARTIGFDIATAKVELVWEPPWTRERMTEAALLELGMM